MYILEKTPKNNRQIALQAIFSVVVLKKSLNDFDFAGNSFATFLSFGTIRFYHHLNHIMGLLRLNGVLLYATCSILEQENQLQIKTFLKEQKDYKLENIGVEWGTQDIGIQKLPSADFDGFYYAKLRKIL